MDGYLTEVLDFFKDAVAKKKTSAVIIIDGKSGMGKTTLAIQCGRYCHPSFDLANIYYDPDAFLEGLANAEPGTFHLFDEAMILSNRSALSMVNRMIVQAMSMIRSRRLYVAFAVNSIFDLDKNLAIFRADLLLHCYGDSLIDRGKFAAFFTGLDGYDRIKDLYLNGKKFYSYGYPQANFFGKFSSEFLVDEDEYNKRKDAGVKKFLESGIVKEDNRGILQRDKLITFIKDKYGISTNEIADICGVSARAIQYSLQRTSSNQDFNKSTKSI